MRVGTFQAAAPGGGAGAAADEHAASDVPPALPPPESSSRERMSAVRTLRGAGGLSLDVPHVSSDEEGEVEGVEAIEEGAELPWNEEEDDYYASDYSEYEEEITWAFYLRWHTAHLLDSPRVQVCLFVATLFSMYAHDVRLIACDKSSDPVFTGLHLLAFTLFATDLALGTWARDHFFLSFIWWLDLLGTLSLILEVKPFFSESLEASWGYRTPEPELPTAQLNADRREGANGYHAGVGFLRAAMIARVVRVLQRARWVYFSRLLRACATLLRSLVVSASQERRGSLDASKRLAKTAAVQASASQAGQILSEEITKQTIVGILICVLVAPLLDYSKYTTRAAYEIHAIQDALAVAHGGADAQTVRALDERLRTFWHVVRLVAPPYFHIDDAAALAALRPWEETELVTVTAGRYSYEAVIDVTADTQMRAASSIGLTTYILLLLITAVFLFNRVSVIYCIRPIESIMQMMRDFSNNPLDKMKTQTLAGTHRDTTELVEAVSKIASLLQIGFGEAGATIIGQNLANGGDINPMAAGRKMSGIFGFVVIFSFADTTEALREGVMLYVNRIAAIVHACVHEFAGSINKNIGEAFLMVWPLDHRAEKRERLARHLLGAADPVGHAPGNGRVPHSPVGPRPPPSPVKGALRLRQSSSLSAQPPLPYRRSAASCASGACFEPDRTSPWRAAMVARRGSNQSMCAAQSGGARFASQSCLSPNGSRAAGSATWPQGLGAAESPQLGPAGKVLVEGDDESDDDDGDVAASAVEPLRLPAASVLAAAAAPSSASFRVGQAAADAAAAAALGRAGLPAASLLSDAPDVPHRGAIRRPSAAATVVLRASRASADGSDGGSECAPLAARASRCGGGGRASQAQPPSLSDAPDVPRRDTNRRASLGGAAGTTRRSSLVSTGSDDGNGDDGGGGRSLGRKTLAASGLIRSRFGTGLLAQPGAPSLLSDTPDVPTRDALPRPSVSLGRNASRGSIGSDDGGGGGGGGMLSRRASRFGGGGARASQAQPVSLSDTPDMPRRASITSGFALPQSGSWRASCGTGLAGEAASAASVAAGKGAVATVSPVGGTAWQDQSQSGAPRGGRSSISRRFMLTAGELEQPVVPRVSQARRTSCDNNGSASGAKPPPKWLSTAGPRVTVGMVPPVGEAATAGVESPVASSDPEAASPPSGAARARGATGLLGGLTLPQAVAPTWTTADCAVAGFALCTLLVRASKQLQQLCSNEVLQRLHPGFTVNTGYGLHLGWAIEGAIGSDLKIDASYLSPNVNLASRLEAATKQYHVRILLSEQVVSAMSPRARACLRRVDRVTVKGSARPITLYTLDLAEDEANLAAAERLDPTEGGARSTPEDEAEALERFRVERAELPEAPPRGRGGRGDRDAELAEMEREALEEIEREVSTFRRTEAVYALRRTTTGPFVKEWDAAMAAYGGGDWPAAAAHFKSCAALVPGDGPTRTLSEYLQRRDNIAPKGWHGVRELTSK